MAENVFLLNHPFCMTIAGVSQSGKTELLKKILKQKENLIQPVPTKVLISYTEEQPAYQEIVNDVPNTSFIRGLDFDVDAWADEPHGIIIIDDQMSDVVKNKSIQELFIKKVHHKSISVIIIQQNLFPQGKHGRDMRLNSHYIVVMKSPTFSQQVAVLGRQLFPRKPSFLLDAYIKATEKPYSFLFINLHPLCEDRFRVAEGLTNPDERYIFLPQ